MLHGKEMMNVLALSLVLTFAAPNSQSLGDSDLGAGLQARFDSAANLRVAIRIADKSSSTDQYTSFETKSGRVAGNSHVRYATRLHLSLELTFTNVGTQPILLFKDSKVVPDWAIGLTEKAALSQKYESEMRSHYIADEDFRRAGWRDDQPEVGQFIILQPGQSQTLMRPYSFVPSDNKGQKLKPGKYFLQLWVQTWYYHADAGSYREQWRDKGYLWSEILKPKPVTFTVEDQ